MTEFNLLEIFTSLWSGQRPGPSSRTSGLALPGFSKSEAIVVKAIEPFRVGRIRFQGSWWSARCNHDITLQPGELVKVVGRQNITLLVEPMLQAQPGLPGMQPLVLSGGSSQ
jgi:membrane protein implicated in regulation of membrane protease activity